MKREKPISKLLQPFVLIVACLGFSFSSDFQIAEKEKTISVAALGDGFVAVLEDYSINWISDEGEIFHSQVINDVIFNTIAASENNLISAGNNGEIYFAKEDKIFKSIYSGTVKEVNCLTLFKNKVLVGYDSGELRIGSLDEKLAFANVELKGNIQSLSSNEFYCYGVTDQGEIFNTSDGESWTVFDFNEIYKGYYPVCTFNKILLTPKQIALVGENIGGEPVMYLSSKGKVWIDRPLIYTDEEGFKDNLDEVPRDIFYDTTHDQYLLLLGQGRLMTIPSCSHCQQLYKVTEIEIQAISGNNRSIILVGENDYIKLINTDLL